MASKDEKEIACRFTIPPTPHPGSRAGVFWCRGVPGSTNQQEMNMPKGKTAKTAAKNARTKINRAKRGQWSQDSKSGRKADFPFLTCNGKRNSTKKS